METEAEEYLLSGEEKGKAPSVKVYSFVLPFTPSNFQAAFTTL